MCRAEGSCGVMIWTRKPDQATEGNQLVTQAQPELLSHRPEVVLYVEDLGAVSYNHTHMQE